MAKKKKETEEVKEKLPTIFDIISYITFNKKKWENLTPYEQGLFNPFMINRFLSMDLSLLVAINELQHYTAKMKPKDIYNLYYHLLPKEKYYLKYISPKKSISDKDLLILQKYFKISLRELEDYYHILMKDEKGRLFFEDLKRQFQYE